MTVFVGVFLVCIPLAYKIGMPAYVALLGAMAMLDALAAPASTPLPLATPVERGGIYRYLGLTLLACAAMAALATGCGDPSSRYGSVRDVAEDMARVRCQVAIECGIYAPDQLDACQYAYAEGACDDVDCATAFQERDEDVDRCLDALAAWPCGLGGVPATCAAVIEGASAPF